MTTAVPPPFAFRPFYRLSDGVIELALEKRSPGDPARSRVPSYSFAILECDSAEKIGSISFRVADWHYGDLPSGGNIGYGVDVRHRGHGYAARACRLLRHVALAHGITSVLITCVPDNWSSRRTCENVGAVLLGVFQIPPQSEMYRRGRRLVCRYEWRIP